MTQSRLPTRRDLVGGVIGLAVAGVYPRALEGRVGATSAQTLASHDPYRYAGKRWWTDDFSLGGVNPDRAKATDPEAGFERYLSVEYMRYTRARPGQEPPTSLPGDNSYGVVAAGGPALLYSVEVFNRWAQDMTAWAKAVREDILRLEDHLKLPHGDPGDPPPVPWK